MIRPRPRLIKIIFFQYIGNLDEILAITLWTDDKVAVANNTSVIKVYDLSNGACQFLRGHKDIVVTLSAQKKWLISGSKVHYNFFARIS